jgi:2-phospho-L-lactate guanylyltransferase
MTLVVVPFHDGKSRLSPERHVRRTIALAMLADVLEACVEVGTVAVVTSDDAAARLAAEHGAAVVADVGGGQGAAVAAALADYRERALVVNADVPAARARDLQALREATPADGLALVAAPDGTTNALGLARASSFVPLYGAGSAGRFVAHAEGRGLAAARIAIPNLRDDVDTLWDLERLVARVGSHTRAAYVDLAQGAAR